MLRKILAGGLILLMVVVGPREVYDKLTDAVSIVWDRTKETVDGLEPPAAGKLREAERTCERLARLRDQAHEAAAVARVEREQARRMMEETEKEHAVNRETARGIAVGLQKAEKEGVDRLTLDMDVPGSDAPGKLTVVQARDLMVAARRRVRYLEQRVGLQKRNFDRTRTLARHWEERVTKLEGQVDEARQLVDQLRLFRDDERAWAHICSLRAQLDQVGDPESDLQSLRQSVAVEYARRGLDTDRPATSADDLFGKIVEDRKASQDLDAFIAELVPGS